MSEVKSQLKKPPKIKIPKEHREFCLMLLDLFIIDGEKGSQKITEGQLQIFYAIVFRPSTRLQIISCTQYGKSLTVALALIIVSCLQNEKVAVLAPKDEQAKIIMRYYIEHIGDNPLFYTLLEKNTKLERLRQEESKQRIILRNGGGVFILSVQAGNSKKGMEAAMGAGAKIVIADESGLIPDQIEATMYRMIAGKGADAFYCKIGNPFYRNHFFKTWHSDKYLKVFIDYHTAIAEGRYNEDFIEEARTRPFFDVLYECRFPSDADIDERGYRFLFTLEELEGYFIDEVPESEELLGTKRLGVDVGRGINLSAFILRYDNVMFIESTNQSRDTMTQVVEIGRIDADETYIDDVGVGGGVTDRALELDYDVTGIREGGSANNKEMFANIKAENYFEMKRWLQQGGRIVRNQAWYQLLEIKYKRNTSGRVQLEPKDELIRRGVPSPDIADAGSLTFNSTVEPNIEFF